MKFRFKELTGTLMNKKVALITGVTGQDGAYLAEFLLNKGYEVHGLRRRASSLNTARIDHLISSDNDVDKLKLHYSDLTDEASLVRLLELTQPDEIYNLGAQSHVHVSFDSPIHTADVNALGALRLLEAIRILGLESKSKYYQASTSELFGKIREAKQSEDTPFYPRSPYGVSKLFAYWATINYREAYGIFACNGILFNHESPLRGETFVTRKVTRGISRLLFGLQDKLMMGNLGAERDWGHAKDYVEMQWLMLQQQQPSDFVIATGEKHTVRDFIEMAFEKVGVKIIWEGKGAEERGIVGKIDFKVLGEVMNGGQVNLQQGDCVVAVDPWYYRPTEVDCLLGDARKAEQELGWTPKISLNELILEMMLKDLEIAARDAHCKRAGYKVMSLENV